MKITTNAIMIVCLVLLAETMCFAAEAVVSKELSTNTQQVLDVSKVRRQQKLRAWVDSIKPAAGKVDPAAQSANEYWRQSVRRENRGSMRE